MSKPTEEQERFNKEELKTKIKEIFQTSPDQSKAIVEIYKLAFPDWDKIKKIEGWPTAGKELSDFIWEQFIKFDLRHHPDLFAGGSWLNYGFSAHDNERLDLWAIDTSMCQVEYEGQYG